MGHWESNPEREIIALQDHLKKQGKAQVNNLTSHLKELAKEQQTKPKVSRRKEIIEIQEEINEIQPKNNTKNQ